MLLANNIHKTNLQLLCLFQLKRVTGALSEERQYFLVFERNIPVINQEDTVNKRARAHFDLFI